VSNHGLDARLDCRMFQKNSCSRNCQYEAYNLYYGELNDRNGRNRMKNKCEKWELLENELLSRMTYKLNSGWWRLWIKYEQERKKHCDPLGTSGKNGSHCSQEMAMLSDERK
jgi:hypothetical protein